MNTYVSWKIVIFLQKLLYHKPMLFNEILIRYVDCFTYRSIILHKLLSFFCFYDTNVGIYSLWKATTCLMWEI